MPAEAYFIHPGELDLCLFNWLDGNDPWQSIYLWDDPADPGRLLSWGMLYSPWSGFDVFVQPELWIPPGLSRRTPGWRRKHARKPEEQGAARYGAITWRRRIDSCGNTFAGGLPGSAGACHALDGMRPGAGAAESPCQRALRCASSRRAMLSSAPGRSILPSRLTCLSRSISINTDISWTFPAWPGGGNGSWQTLMAMVSFCMAWPDSASRIGQSTAGHASGIPAQGPGEGGHDSRAAGFTAPGCLTPGFASRLATWPRWAV